MPATPINRPDPGNMGFLRALLAAIIFMILSGLILVSGFLAWHYPELTAGSNIKPITLTGNDLYIAIGKGEAQDSKLIVSELIEDGTAVISSRRTRFDASNYPILEYKITGRNPGTDVVLYWRTTTHNKQTLFAKLHWNSDYKTAYNLHNHTEWKGKITELGISVAGDLRSKPISIKHLTFTPLTIKSLLLAAWSEWNAFEGWTHSSINAIKGAPTNALISPIVAATAWCGLAILIYSLKIIRTSVARRDALLSVDRNHPGNSIWHITKRIWDIRAVVTMFLIAWLALDGKWQVNLWRQLASTEYLFAGKTHHEQHLAADDAELYAYATRLKENVLPEEPARIFILSNNRHDHTPLKLMYYLLPHNVHNLNKYPNPNILKEGDYILAVNPIEDLSYSDNDTMLHYDRNRSTKVKLLDKTRLATLFKAKSTAIYLGQLNAYHSFNRDPLAGRLMENPVLIAGISSFNSRDPGVPALNKDKNNRLRLRFQEWEYCDGRHATEKISILALEQRIHHMPDGSIWEVGTSSLNSTRNPLSIHFTSNFPKPPKLFLTPQTSSDQTATSVRASKVTNTGFQLIANTQESKKGQLDSTTVGYLAISAPSNQGTVVIENKEIPYRLSQTTFSSHWHNVYGYDLFLQEEQSQDHETKHASERVDVMEIDGNIFAQVVSNKEPDTVSIRMRQHRVGL